MNGYWTLTGEITNTNPYTVFVAVPDKIEFTDKSLISSKDFLKVSLSDNIENNTRGVVFYNAVLNGKKGFWIPPYTTMKINTVGLLDYTLNVDESQTNYDIAGPALVDTTKILNLKKVFPIYKKGVMLDDFKLYVRGSIKKQNSEVISMVVPAPLVLKDYYQFNKVLGRHDIDVWVDSYNSYIHKHKEMTYKQNPDLYNNVDDALVPNMGDDLGNENINLKLFDVPAMVFTTSDNHNIDYAYVIYWDKKYSDD